MNKNNRLLAKCFSICLFGNGFNYGDIVSNLELYSLFGDYVFCVHGECEQRHIHIVFKPDKATTVKCVSKLLGVPEQFINPVYGSSAFDDYVEYFADMRYENVK